MVSRAGVAICLAAFVSGFSGCAGRAHKATSVDRDDVMAVFAETPLIDGHNDVPWQYRERVSNDLDAIDIASDTSTLQPPMHTDLNRLRQGGVGAQFWSVYIPVDEEGGRPGDAAIVIDQIDLTHRLIDRYPDLELALSAKDIERIHRQGKIASLLGMEGGHSIENSLAVLRATYDLGARYMTVTHSSNIPWADSATDEPLIGGLTPFGVEVIREMNRLGMFVDLSHVSPDVMHQTLDITESPIIFSHSSARALCDHPRNVPDDVLLRLPETDGVVMVTFVQSYVSEELRVWYEDRQAERRRQREAHGENESAYDTAMAAWAEARPQPRATLAQVADHIDHIRDVVGIDYIGIGGDFDGIGQGPIGLEDVSTYPDLFLELANRGYTNAELKKIAGENLLRVMRKMEKASKRIQQERGPSGARFEVLDAEFIAED